MKNRELCMMMKEKIGSGKIPDPMVDILIVIVLKQSGNLAGLCVHIHTPECGV